jgi:hypothetical protein
MYTLYGFMLRIGFANTKENFPTCVLPSDEKEGQIRKSTRNLRETRIEENRIPNIKDEPFRLFK